MRLAFDGKPRVVKHGGKRDGAGRKPMGKKSGTPHRKRYAVDEDSPLMITMKICKGLPSLRCKQAHDLWRDILRVIRRERKDFRIIHYALMGNHIHMLVEGDSAEAVSKGMISLQVRFARRWNKMLGRKGKVFADRYHHLLIDSPHAARRAIAYVLNNARKHGIRLVNGLFDPYSSAPLFHGWKLLDGFKEEINDVKLQDVVSEPRSSLLVTDWHMAGGLIYPRTVPGPR